MTCKHRFILVPDFPGDGFICADCHLPMEAGSTNGIRDYRLPDDPYWRRQSQLRKLEWLRGGDDLEQCPVCCFVGTIDDFDVMGADEGHLFCGQCGVEFVQEPESLYAFDVVPSPFE